MKCITNIKIITSKTRMQIITIAIYNNFCLSWNKFLPSENFGLDFGIAFYSTGFSIDFSIFFGSR